MTRETQTQAIKDAGIIAIIRANCPVDNVVIAIGALLEGGIHCIEVTMTTPGILDCLERATEAYAHTPLLLGVGSVTDVETCVMAIESGAQYVVCPAICPEVIKAVHDHDKPVLPGAYTPTEILQAWDFEGDLIKLFPAAFGGVPYMNAVRAPLPHIPLVPTGGITVENMGDFIGAGAVALGVGGNLAGAALIEAGDWPAITRNARAFVQALDEARG